MNAKLRKRIIAFVLCMVMVLSSGTAAQADDAKPNTNVTDEMQNSQDVQSEAVTDSSETKAETAEEVPSEEVPEEVPAEAPATTEVKTEWIQQVGDATVKVIADEGALPQDAVLYASQIIDKKEVEEIEKIVEEKSIQEQVVAEKMVAYDIKFMVGDSEVQPGSPVQVLVDTPEIESGKNASVIHVAENDETEDMKGTVDNEGNVVFEAPHFSRYVIIQEGGNAVNVKIEHYNDTTKEKIYSDDELKLPVGGKVNDYAKATNWDVSSVVIGDKIFTTEEDYSEIKAAKDINIKVYYTPKKTTVSGATTFYDYTVQAGESGKESNKTFYSINAPQNYTNSNSSTKLSAGLLTQNYAPYQYRWTTEKDRNHITNAWTGSKDVVKELLKGLDENGEVVFNYEEPGFFDDDDLKVRIGAQERYLRQVYKDYKLSFEQIGDSYKLESVQDGSENTVAHSGAGFFPLDSETKTYEAANAYEGKHNYFFGMRYDVTFKIGDYVGALDYTFTGDDDLWVVLDGKEVVIDLGGIHDAATGSVDLWEYIGKPEELTPEKKQEEHTLTILYMERGGYKSNCQMNFTLPSASISEVTEVPMTNLLLQKVNSKNEPLEGAKFRLTNMETGDVSTAASIENGAVQFTKLRVGEYTLEETQAPSGYIATVNEWKVKVTLDEDTGRATAAVYLIDGETEAKVDPNNEGIYIVVNVTEQELINSSMDYNKTATVKDWNERTYDINISASSKLTKTLTDEKGGVADGVLVLDQSGSMNLEAGSKKLAELTFVGRYSNIKEALDTTKIYYGGGAKYAESSQQMYASQPIVYSGNSWKIFKNKEWASIKDDDSREIYTWDARLTGLKEATTAFVSSASAASPDSLIGITGFNTSNQEIRPLKKIGSDVTSLVENIDSVVADGGTSPAKGLEYAYNSLKNGKRTDIPQYIVLFTDGEPTGDGNVWNDKEAYKAKFWADSLKQEGIVIYTVGLCLTEKAKGWLDGSYEIQYNSVNISGIASKDCAFTVENIGDLKKIFKKIQETVTENIDIFDAQIKDVIDPRFVIVDDNGTPITEDYPGIKEGITLTNGGTVYYDQETGTQYIAWMKQRIPNGINGSKWNKTITVKAKENFIGGNNVTTNISPDSKITTVFGDAALPQPTVNVKAELEISNQKVTIYNGDTVPTENEILDSLFTTTYIGNHGVKAEDFKFSWYTNPDCSDEPISTEALSKTTPGSDISYYLKVTYDAGEPTEGSNNNTSKDGKVYIAGEEGHIVEAVNNGQQDGKDSSEFANLIGKSYGVYKIKVIQGELVITKTLQKASDKDETFTFIVKKAGEAFKEVQITVPKGDVTATFLMEELKNLPRGNYEITEKADEVYGLQNVEINKQDTNCDNSSTEKSATFTLGNNNGDVIKNHTYNKNDGGTIGTVTFTNAAVIRDWSIVKRSTSSEGMFLEGAEFRLWLTNIPDIQSTLTYYGRSKSDGEVEWFRNPDFTESIGTEDFTVGTYMLTEQKAPTGYALSQESWKVEIGKGGLLSITSAGKEPTHDSEIIMNKEVVSFYFDNTPVYDLPDAGGSGIYWYMIGGMLLMFAAALILYKRRCKEVLKN